jgi:hypothetical protein
MGGRTYAAGARPDLGLARAYKLHGLHKKLAPPLRTPHQDTFSLWKDAGPNIPILQQAKPEYAKLQ